MTGHELEALIAKTIAVVLAIIAVAGIVYAEIHYQTSQQHKMDRIEQESR